MKRLIINTALTELGIGLQIDEQLFTSYGQGTERHSSSAMAEIERLLREHQLKPAEIDELIVIDGPGAFTGVRIGITIAKTWGFALGTPVKVINSLEALAMQAADGTVMPVIDAKREAVFAAVYQKCGDKLETVVAEGLYPVSEASQYLLDYSAQTIGETISGLAVSLVLEPLRIELTDAIRLAALREPVADIHGLLPLYLKKSQAEQEADGQ